MSSISFPKLQDKWYAIKPNYFTAVHSLVGGGINGHPKGPVSEYEFHDGQTPPTESAIQTELTRLLEEWAAQEYSEMRKSEYERINQFELISDDAINGTTTHKDAIEAIKTKWPKDNSGPT